MAAEGAESRAAIRERFEVRREALEREEAAALAGAETMTTAGPARPRSPPVLPGVMVVEARPVVAGTGGAPGPPSAVLVGVPVSTPAGQSPGRPKRARRASLSAALGARFVGATRVLQLRAGGEEEAVGGGFSRPPTPRPRAPSR